MSATHLRGAAMWILELNIAGHTFTREMPDLRRRPLRFSARHLHWPAVRHHHEPSHAA
ncbi:hypothetical protein [Mycobacterium sp. TY815]|uniref:hypothetical protein n=1 Tax=Mycobacterium sp. TY815 TaxID=3050581 RepID=UPI0027416B92|nr:hypothetical protein [Mycobacterium sp. TY815]MDP7704418.1 hypothetical protein [Mycobacterium sp. TY815]